MNDHINIFKNDHIDIKKILINILKKTLLIFCQYQYFHKRCQYFIDISKNANISTIDISIFHKKKHKWAETKQFPYIDIFKNVLIDVDTDIAIFRIVLIVIDIFKNGLIDINTDIDIVKNHFIDIDSDIDICQKCRYIDN